MKRVSITMLVILVLSAILVACTPAATPAPAVEPTKAPDTSAPAAQPTTAPAVEPTKAPVEAPQPAAPVSLKVGMSTEAISMDPHVGNDSNTSTALLLTFEGLLNVVNGKIEPGMAESYEVSDDGTVYTFHLRDAKWSDGKPVTASDFADTYKRMLTRKDAMDLAYLIFPIKNAQPINAGEMDVKELGVQVKDEKTLVITLGAAYPVHGNAVCLEPYVPHPQRPG